MYVCVCLCPRSLFLHVFLVRTQKNDISADSAALCPRDSHKDHVHPTSWRPAGPVPRDLWRGEDLEDVWCSEFGGEQRSCHMSEQYLIFLFSSSSLRPSSVPQTHSISRGPVSLSPLSPSQPKGPPLYLQVPLCAVLTWDSATRQRLLFEVFVLSSQTDGECVCTQLVCGVHVQSTRWAKVPLSHTYMCIVHVATFYTQLLFCCSLISNFLH